MVLLSCSSSEIEEIVDVDAEEDSCPFGGGGGSVGSMGPDFTVLINIVEGWSPTFVVIIIVVTFMGLPPFHCRFV